MPKFFVKNDNVFIDKIIVTGDDANHIKNVLRCKIGEKITLCDGNGNDYNCAIKNLETDIELEILEKYICESEPKTKITLFQGLPKSDKMELIIQKCVELGVDKIVPVYTERVIVKLDNKDKELKKILRWQKISEAAAKQSGRGKIPQIGEVVSFNEALKISTSFSGAIIPYEKEKNCGLKEFLYQFKGSSIAVFIGPEGGFTTEEIEMAAKNNVKSLSLGKRILRTETAGISTLAILLYELG